MCISIAFMASILDMCTDIWWSLESCGDCCLCGLQEVPTIEGSKVRQSCLLGKTNSLTLCVLQIHCRPDPGGLCCMSAHLRSVPTPHNGSSPFMLKQSQTLILARRKEGEAGRSAKGVLDSVNFTPQGPAGIFGLYVAPGSKLGQVFLNEFLCVR